MEQEFFQVFYLEVRLLFTARINEHQLLELLVPSPHKRRHLYVYWGKFNMAGDQ
jgi:hypothetical protein